MEKKKVDFENIKAMLLNKSSLELSNIIRSTKYQDEAMFLFWALDYLNQHQKEIPDDKAKTLMMNKELLHQAQEVVFRENLAFSLKEYSAGFVLGTLEFGVREREAQIDRYQEYIELYNKIQAWPKLGFPNEQFKKQWEERIKGIQEIQDWMNSRANDWFPALIPIYRTGKFHKSTKKALKALRKGREDDIVFQILAALLHSNPILDQRIKDFCKENKISMVDKTTLTEILSLLADETSNKKVKKYCNLLLSKKEEGEK